MANDSLFPEEGKRPAKDTSSDSGLGNLPPLSDFDSQAGLTPSDSGALPPLGNFNRQSGGLPAISDIDIETPNPTGGNVRATPPGFSSGLGDSFSSGSGLETPSNPSGGGLSTPGRSGGAGFQDLAADSDFSPETPEIGPGPDSNVDTPMFDSAFGGGSGGFGAAVSTPMATQAMETPMFGGSTAPPAGGGGDAFGKDTFGGGFDFNAGTPPPDFSPDTDMRQQFQPATTGADGGKKGKGGKAPKSGGGGGGSPAVLAGAAVAALIVGILAGPYVSSFVPFLPNPSSGQIADLTKQNTTLKAENEKLKNVSKDGGPVKISPEELKKLQADVVAAKEELNTTEASLTSANTELGNVKSNLDQVNKDLADKNAQYVTAQEQLEEISNQTAIVQARQTGLVAEVERLTNQVGELEEANVRSVASKHSLETAVDRLIVQIKEGIPLTPEKYAYSARLAKANALRDKLADSKWITPELQQDYTDLYLSELNIAQAQEYFFAKLTVTDEYGTRTQKWAECLMKGNWGVDYRTLDGKNIGSYENIATPDAPVWGYREDLPQDVKKAIEDRIIANRVPDWMDKVTLLAQKQLAMDNETGFQKAYGSL